MTRAAVIDNSAISRVGTVVLLEQLGIEVVVESDHDRVLEGSVPWNEIDLVVMGGVDRTRCDDQFPGPAVVAAFRRLRGAERGSAVVITPLAHNPRLRRRLWEAGADVVADPADITTADALASVIRGTESRHRLEHPEPLWNEPALGIERTSRINEFVEKARELGVHHLDGSAGDEVPPARSRWWLHLRRDLTIAGRLRVVNRDGSIPDRNQMICSIGQLRRVYEWASKIDPILD